MTQDRHTTHKDALRPFREALYASDISAASKALAGVLAPDCTARLFHPLGDVTGAEAVMETLLAPLADAFPDLERRDWIVAAGETREGADWVGCGGHYAGLFARPWLDIPPTGHWSAFRFHEFYRFEDGRVTEMQILWDVPELIRDAKVWPLAPSLGREGLTPSPATQDGLVRGPHDEARSNASRDLVLDMLDHMTRHPSQGGPEVMEMDRFWHPHFSWYGPSGIGTARSQRGFRHWHQIPFLNAMPDRKSAGSEKIDPHFFGDGDYAAVTGWPNMDLTLTAGGWLGIAPAGRAITARSLDFWRIENGLIRENWVLVDLLDIYAQLDVDPLARMREFNKARVGFDPETGRAL